MVATAPPPTPVRPGPSSHRNDPLGPEGADVLTKVGLFAGLSREALLPLGTALRRRRYPRGTVIFMEGDPGTTLFIIESGTVKIGLSTPDGKELVIALLGRGEHFGDFALLDGEPRSADAIAKTDCQLLLLSREDFQAFLERHPRVAFNLLASLSHRLRVNTTMLQEAAFLDIPARVASALLQLAEEQGRAGPDGTIVIDSTYTQAELAGHVGATRESVNKWLRYYERQGLIHWGKGAIAILKPEDLRRRVY